MKKHVGSCSVVLLVVAASMVAFGAGAVSADRDVLAWGHGGYGQLGNGTQVDRSTPVGTAGFTAALVSAGYYHSLALKSDGTVWAWGWGAFGQLGNGTVGGGDDDEEEEEQEPPPSNESRPVRVTNLEQVIAVDAGGFHSLALKSDGTVWAWGHGGYGQLGNGVTGNSSVPAQVAGLEDVIAVSGGLNHSLALKSDGTVWAWGKNDLGQVGDGSEVNRFTPVQVPGIAGAVAIAGGGFHSAAVLSNGTAFTWGEGSSGQLGNGTYLVSLTPTQVSGLTEAVAIATGFGHTLAIRSDGTVRAWGWGEPGQLGDGKSTRSAIPVEVENLTAVTAVAAGFTQSVALRSDGTVWAWGGQSNGELGDGSYVGPRPTPFRVPVVTYATSIAAGNSHSLATGLLPSSQCDDGTQVLDQSDSQLGRRIYFYQPNEYEFWTCIRIVAVDQFVGGKLILPGMFAPGIPANPIRASGLDECDVRHAEQSLAGQLVKIKTGSDSPKVCLFVGDSWTSVSIELPNTSGMPFPPVQFIPDPL